MTNPTKTRRRFTALQKQEAIALCLSEVLSCTAVVQRLGIPVSSLAKWVRQARIDRGDLGPPDQGQLTSEETAELVSPRQENRELMREKDFFRLVPAHFAKEQLSPRGFALSRPLRTASLCPGCAISWLWPAAASMPGGSGNRTPVPGPRRTAAITTEVAAVF
jgi:transposase-like protein